MNSRLAGGPAGATDPLDEPVELSRLLPDTELDELVGTFAAAHDCAVVIADREGRILAQAGAASTAAAVTPIEYLGETVGSVAIDLDPPRPVVGRHMAHVIELLLHHAHARRLAGVVHEAAIASSVAELTAKNRSLEAAVDRLRAADRVLIAVGRFAAADFGVLSFFLGVTMGSSFACRVQLGSFENHASQSRTSSSRLRSIR